MNKVLSQAIKKAVSEFKPQVDQKNKTKGPDLFSLNNNTELFQNSRGITIKIDRSRDENLTDFGKATLSDRRWWPNCQKLLETFFFFEKSMLPFESLRNF